MIHQLSIDWSVSELQHLNFRRHPPSLPLRPYVQCYWSLIPDSRPSMPLREKLYPDAGSGLIFDFSDSAAPLVQYGYHIYARDHVITGASRRFGIRFLPGGAAHLLGLDLGGLGTGEIPALDLGVPELSGLHTRMAESSPQRWVALAEGWLLQRLKGAGEHDQLIEHALTHLTATRRGTGSLSSMLGVSRRLLERRFRSLTGLSPQQTRRIVQLRQARFMIKRAPDTAELADIAVACGFYDQPHFTRAFTQHTGVTPGTYRERQLARRAAGELRILEANHAG